MYYPTLVILFVVLSTGPEYIAWFLDYSSHLCISHISWQYSFKSWILIFSFITKIRKFYKKPFTISLSYSCFSNALLYYHFYENLHCSICIASRILLASEFSLKYMCICATMAKSLFQNIPSKPYHNVIFLHLRPIKYSLFEKSIYFALFWLYKQITCINKGKRVYYFPYYALYICANIFIWKCIMDFPEVCPNHIQIMLPFWWIWICLNNLGFFNSQVQRKKKKSNEVKRLSMSCPKLLLIL